MEVINMSISTNLSSNSEKKESHFPATVAEVIDESTVVINRGSAHNIYEGQKFLIYRLSDKDIIDPETRENLGKLEIARGTGNVTHVQEKMATIHSDRSRPGNRTDFPLLSGLAGYPRIHVPFNEPQIGDHAKPV